MLIREHSMAKSRKRQDTAASSATSQSASATLDRTDGNPSPNGEDRRDRIAQRAYELYLQRGGTHGSDWDDWLRAEREVLGANEGERTE